MSEDASENALAIGPLRVVCAGREAALSRLSACLNEKRGLRVAFANTNLIYQSLRNGAYANELSSFHILNDGIGLEIIARLLHGRGFPDNLNGTDFTPLVLKAAPPGARIALVGAKPPALGDAVKRVKRDFPDLTLCFAREGHFADDDADLVADQLTAAAPDIVLVAMGNPRQERIIALFARSLPNAVLIGVGALFDFWAGDKPRAPALMRRLKLEWLFRLSLEPSRLWRRYTIEAAYVACTLLWRKHAPGRHSASLERA
jgi:exopolysaccharide biosynthesis WecB/TagA/CpsF family protein